MAWTQPPIAVAVTGAVRDPGTFEVPFGTTVAEAIERAGGATSAADPSLVEMAATVTAGATVRVPRRVTDRGEARVNVNLASLRDLDDLPGIGPALAQRIVAGRPFARVDDLLDVPGIGPATLERLRPRVTLR